MKYLKKDSNIYRHEIKYRISLRERELIRLRLGELLLRDPHAGASGIYKIRSLYFDDYWNSAYYEKIMGSSPRRKYRIRVYNDDDSVINLERKIKSDNYISKQSAKLTRQDTDDILIGKYNFLLNKEQKLCKEFYYECTTKLMRPSVIVDYDREPFIFYTGDVRITFDMNLRAGLLRVNLFDKDLPTLNAFEDDSLIMEVKYTEVLPDLIRKLLNVRSSELIAVSKYVLCRDCISFMSAQI